MTISICFELRANSAIKMWPYASYNFQLDFGCLGSLSKSVAIHVSIYTTMYYIYRYVNRKSISKVAVRLHDSMMMVSGLMAVLFMSN